MPLTTDIRDFFATTPVFTTAEFAHALRLNQATLSGDAAVWSALRYHRHRGRIVQIWRGLYAVVPPGLSPDAYPVDKYLVASRAAPDAIIGLHSALELYGAAQSLLNICTYYSAIPHRPRTWRGVTYLALPHPPGIVAQHTERAFSRSMDRAGLTISLTTLERTVIDVLANPKRAGGLEEVWRSLELVSYLDLPAAIAYAKARGEATTAAKLGFFLEQHREQVGVSDDVLRELEMLRPSTITYLMRDVRRDGELASRWNLMVPTELMQSWNEIRADEEAFITAEHGRSV